MAEEIDYPKEGRRIAGEYLNGMGWAGEWRRVIANEPRPHTARADVEQKFDRTRQIADDAEAKLARDLDVWLKSKDPMRFVVLETVYNILARRSDLGFLAKQAVARIKKNLPVV